MLIKVVVLFLLIMVALALWGRLRPRQKAARFCPQCGAPRTGPGRCPCGR